jgi:ribosomal protein S18 acetylase RimI-like enzyme
LATFNLHKVDRFAGDVASYLRGDLVRNAMDLWLLRTETRDYELHVSRREGKIEAHLGIYHAPEAPYVSVDGDPVGVEPLLELVPSRAVLLLAPELFERLEGRFSSLEVYHDDLMVLHRGQEKLVSPDLAVRLSETDAEEYSSFGSRFRFAPDPIDRVRRRLKRDPVFGALSGDKLVSVARVAAWLPEMAVIMGVETLPEFRGRGFGTIAVSGAVHEALRRSRSCSLGVRSDNVGAMTLYHKLGFEIAEKEVWVDKGTGLKP